MLKVNHAIYNNMEISDYRAKFITYVERGMGGKYEIFNTLADAEKNMSYEPIYIAFELKSK
jgi:hypothetical protein